MGDGVSSVFRNYWQYALEHFQTPIEEYYIKLFSTIFAHFTVFNLIILLIKYVPMGIYTYKFITSVYTAFKQKQIELEDIKLQIQIVNTKLGLCEAECAERRELLRRKVEQLRILRKRVQEMIAANNELRNTIYGNAPWEDDANCDISGTPKEESKFIVELLKDQAITPERDMMNMSCGEHSTDHISAENSVYSSANDVENNRDYHIKIVKVTNIYKVAYLRHFIKQKRLQRANKQAVLRKKMDNIKKLLDDWQKSLKMVINNKLPLVNLNLQHLEIASQEAMGDFSKPKFNSFPESDSDLRNSIDSCQDDYCASWSQNQYRPIYSYNYDDLSMNFEVRRDCYDLDDCCNKYNGLEKKCVCDTDTGVLFVVPEETNSQVEIEEIKNYQD